MLTLCRQRSTAQMPNHREHRVTQRKTHGGISRAPSLSKGRQSWLRQGSANAREAPSTTQTDGQQAQPDA